MTPEAKPVSVPVGEWYIEHLENDENTVFIHIDEPSGALHEVCETSPEYAELIVRAVNRDHLFDELVKVVEKRIAQNKYYIVFKDPVMDKETEYLEDLLKQAKELSK